MEAPYRSEQNRSLEKTPEIKSPPKDPVSRVANPTIREAMQRASKQP